MNLGTRIHNQRSFIGSGRATVIIALSVKSEWASCGRTRAVFGWDIAKRSTEKIP